MKKALLIFVIGLFSINVFAQSDTIAINQENRNTTIVIPQFGTTEISVVLDILNQNSKIFNQASTRFAADDKNRMEESYENKMLNTITDRFVKNNYLSNNDIPILMGLVKIAQRKGILYIDVEYPPIEKSYSDMAKSQKSVSNSLKVIATTSVISFVVSIVTLIIAVDK